MFQWLHRFRSSLQQPLVSEDNNGTAQLDPYSENTIFGKVSPDDFSSSIKDTAWTGAHDIERTNPFSSTFIPYRGLLYSLLSSVFFSLSSVIVKYLDEVPPGELAVTRFLGILIFTLPIVIYSQQKIFGPQNVLHLLILRGVLGATGLYLMFIAFRYLAIADASVIVFSFPAIVSVLAKILLREPCGFIQSVTTLLTLVGIVLITKLPFSLCQDFTNYDTQHLYGIAGALGSTVLGACAFIVTRKLADIHHAIISFNYSWVALVGTVILTFATSKFTVPLCGMDQWLMVLLGIFSFCGQMLLTLALKEEHAGPVATVRAGSDIIFAFVWQIWFFNEIPDVYSISGALLVSSCVVFMSFHKWLTHR